MTTFEAALERYLQQLESGQNASEDTIRDRFFTFLREAFPHLKAPRQVKLEEYVPGLAVCGRADALLGEVIIEFKRQLDTESKRKAAIEQLDRYLRNANKLYGIITDGKRLIARARHNDNFKNISEIVIDSRTKPSDIQLWLDMFLFVQEKQKPTAEDIVRRYGLYSPTFIKSIHDLRTLWNSLSADSNIRTKYVEWESLMGIVYGSSPSEGEELFLKHTYLSIFARVLAFVTLENKPVQREEVAELLSGEVFERKGYTNLVEEDFFNWLSPKEERVREWIALLSEGLFEVYDLTQISEDLLKELYQELVGPEMRHDTGEYYTPDWVAEQVLREAGFPPESKNPEEAALLDPACGSGTFLFIALRLLQEAGWSPQSIETFVTEHLRGMDINPLAVIIARINIVLALRSILQNRKPTKPITLPVYLANALIVKSPDDNKPVLFDIPVENIEKIKGENPPVKSFQLPPLHKPDEYDSLIKGLAHYARLDDKAYEEVKEGFRSYLERKGVDESHYPWWLQNLRLLRWLMKKPETDTVWLFLLRNALMPTYCARRPYAFVVGNPPWIAYRYLKTESYQDLVRRLFQEFDLIPKARGNLTTQLELATLFFAVSAKLYVREGGVVAFVMPRSILTGSKQHSPFQERYVSKSFLILDYERVEPLFNAPTCAILWKRQHSESPSSDSVFRKVISGNLPWRNMPWNDVQRYLTIEAQEWVYHPSSTSSSPYHSRFKNGATIVPRTFWFVRPTSGGYYETDERILSYAKEPWKNFRLEGAIEEPFLYGTLLSNDLLPFGWRNLSLVVLPLLDATLLDASKANKKGYIKLAEWLASAENKWEENKKSDDNLIEYLNWQNKLTSQNPRAPYRLLYNRSGTYLSAAVLEWKDDTEVMQVRVNGFFADTTTYVYVSSDPKELHFLCAILNAPSVDAAIKPYQTKGSFGARSGKGERDIHRRPFEVLDIPLYDPHDEDHRKLAELSQQAHNDVRNFLENASPKDQDKPIGELRQDIRKKVIKEALSEIDKIVKRLLRL